MKRTVKIIGLFLVAILCIGVVSSLFNVDSDEPSGPGTIVQRPPADYVPKEPEVPDEPDVPEEPEACSHVDADDNNFCDLCEEVFSDGQDLFGGKVTSLDTFDEYVYFDDLSNKPNMQSFNPHAKYGTFTTEDGYAKLFTTDSDVGTTSDSFFGIYANDEREPISLNSFEYMTIDFDFWTDSEYISPVHFIFVEDASTAVTSDNHFMIYKNDDGGYSVEINGYQYSSDPLNKEISLSEKLHITFLVKSRAVSGTSSRPDVQIYVNGEYLTDFACNIQHFYQFEQLRVLFPTQTVEAGKSVCMDNIQVSTFGSSGNTYSGDIKDAWNNKTNLTECADSVLFTKNN